ncbi:MAG: aminotransferase class V-fold PLP-dependent enzyme [Oscillospiraceae bacterium]|nr:aminotransferase class V-fold PLP-dependent enzyme [Oscillospiraceae bacterium]MBR6618488.1 aminotransferase class V-fold PLP-dependent enzyme [Oscillospiraceae bacterium]
MVNFDNAATTFPKPPEVRLAVEKALVRYGSAGRGGHPIAARTSEMVYAARETAADFFGAQPEQVVFTLNCTHALNLAIQGMAQGGGHFVISDMEHNSVLRPVYALAKKGKIRYSIAAVKETPAETVQSFRSQLRPDTKAVICMLASNVTGQILPWREIGAICQQRGICFIADGAQGCGTLPVKLSDGINILCTAGHKGLYGITGTGLLISDGKFPLPPLMQGGTGSISNQPEQPDFLPDSLECGTLNVIGAASVKAGIEFVRKKGIPEIFRAESALCGLLAERLRSIPNVIVYRSPRAEYAPIVSFNIRDLPSEETAQLLAKEGFCLRAGLHCAPLAHHRLGTENGTVRFAPSVFSRPQDVLRLAEAVRGIAENNKNFM